MPIYKIYVSKEKHGYDTVLFSLAVTNTMYSAAPLSVR